MRTASSGSHCSANIHLKKAKQHNKQQSHIPQSEIITPCHRFTCWKLCTKGWRSVKEGAQTHKHGSLCGSAFILNTQRCGATKMFCSLTSIVYSCKSASDKHWGRHKNIGASRRHTEPCHSEPDVYFNAACYSINRYIFISIANIAAEKP